MNRFKRLISTMLSVMMITSLTFGAAWGATPWNAQIRPGVMTGGNQTDFMLDMFIPVAGNEKNIFFLNPHVRFDDKSGNEQNIGLGFRTFLSGDNVILGANAYYDSMKSEYSNRYGQFGLGMEVLSKWVDFRANYYSPTGSRKNKVHSLDKYSFANTSLILNEGYEAALRGFDAEVGVMIPGISDVIETRAFVGGFWYDSPISRDVNGWKGRIEIKPSKLINIDVEMRNDPVRGTDTFYGAYLDIPFSIDELTKGGNPFKGFKEAAAFGKGSRSMKERMTQKVVRDRYITTIADASNQDKETIINDMIYVSQDNTGDPDRNGSLKHPWESVNEAEANDPRWQETEQGVWVYVFHKDKNHLNDPAGNEHVYEDNHTQLANNMVLWGEGYYMNEPGRPWKLGGLNGASNTDMNPILDGGNYIEPLVQQINGGCYDPVVCLANNNEIMGLTMQNGSHGIYGNTIYNTNIHDNIIRWNGGENSGIHIDDYFEASVVSGMTLTYTIANNYIYENNGDGIHLRHYISDDFSDSLTGLTINNNITGNKIGIDEDDCNATNLYSNAVDLKNEVSGPGTVDGNTFNNTFTGNTVYQYTSEHAVKIQNVLSTDDDYTVIKNNTINNTIADNEIEHNGSGGSEWFNGNAALFVWNWLRTSDDDVIIQDNTVKTDISCNTITETGDGHGIQVTNELDTPFWTRSADNLLIKGNTFETTIAKNDVYQNTYESWDGIYVANWLGIDSDWTDNATLTENTFTTTYNENNVWLPNGLLTPDSGIYTENYAEIYNQYGDDNVLSFNTFTTTAYKNVIESAGDYAGIYTDNWLGTYADENNTVANNTLTTKYLENDVTMTGSGEGLRTDNELDVDGTDDYDTFGDWNTFNTTYEKNTITTANNDGIYQYNRLDGDHDNDDLYVRNNTITTTLTGNTITVNSDDGVHIESVIDSANGNTLSGNTIENLFTGGNLITVNASGGSWDDGVFITNDIDTNTNTLITNTTFRTVFSGVNTIHQYGDGNGIRIMSEVENDWDDYVVLSNISFINDIAGVTVNGHDAGGTGIRITDYLESDRNYQSLMSGISFNNTLTGNTISGFTTDQVSIYHEIYTDDDNDGPSTTAVVNISYTDVFEDNTITGTGSSLSGVEILSDIYDPGFNDPIWGGISYTARLINNTIQNNDDGVWISYEYNNGDDADGTLTHLVRMEGNKIINNTSDGVNLDYNNGSYVGDLGGGGYSAGNNSFYGNGDDDIDNNSGSNIWANFNYYTGGAAPTQLEGGFYSNPFVLPNYLTVDPNP